jgi:hypothetical protein
MDISKNESTYSQRRRRAMIAIHAAVMVPATPDQLQDDLAAFREDLQVYEANHLDNLAAWARTSIARIEKQLEGQS